MNAVSRGSLRHLARSSSIATPPLSISAPSQTSPSVLLLPAAFSRAFARLRLSNVSQDINSIYNVLELLQGRVRSTEALVMVKLDIARNRILTAGLIFSMGSACLTVGALVSGLFGEPPSPPLRHLRRVLEDAKHPNFLSAFSCGSDRVV